MMCEVDGETPRTEYDDDIAVYLVDDGERHHYVARDFVSALREHFSLMDPESDEFTVTRVDADKTLTRSEIEGITEDFPETFTRTAADHDNEYSHPSVATTAAEWAAFYAAHAPYQLMSSVF